MRTKLTLSPLAQKAVALLRGNYVLTFVAYPTGFWSSWKIPAYEHKQVFSVSELVNALKDTV